MADCGAEDFGLGAKDDFVDCVLVVTAFDCKV